MCGGLQHWHRVFEAQVWSSWLTVMAAHTSCKWGSKDEQQVLLNMRGREGDKWGETKILGRSRRHESLFAHTVGYQGTCEGAGAGQQARLRVGDLSSESVFHRGKRAPRNQATEAWADQKPAPPPPREPRGGGTFTVAAAGRWG